MAADTQIHSDVGTGDRKPVHTLLLDASPILLNTPAISTLLATCDSLVTTPTVISEIRGEEARNRLDTLYKPFLTIRSPVPRSVQHIRDFARRTGDLSVLSTTDIEILALAYDLECERNGGDWRLKDTPGQKGLNGNPPKKDRQSEPDHDTTVANEIQSVNVADMAEEVRMISLNEASLEDRSEIEQLARMSALDPADNGTELKQGLEKVIDQANATVTQHEEFGNLHLSDELLENDSDSDSEEGWITPANIQKHRRKEEELRDTNLTEGKHLQVATITGDFAMQNVLLQMNLNLLSTKSCKRVTYIKQTILRCHACFAITRDMSKQFCFRCGKPTLTRVTSTTNDKGEMKLHLKSNFQWNNRGNVYSIPKPVSGNSNQKWKGPQQGGGKGGWGSGLVLTEDQKEYARAKSNAAKAREQNLMDEDFLPSILSGQRQSGGNSVKVGAGRNINKVNRRKR